MTSLQIRYFLKVAEMLSFTNAGKELYVSQPALTKQVMNLEKELGYKLFDRTVKNRITLTPVGMLFYERFNRIEKDLRDAHLTASRLRSDKRLQIRVGVLEGWDYGELLTRVRRSVDTGDENAAIEFECYPFREMFSLLASNDLDVLMCVETALSSFEDLNVIHIADVTATIYMGARNPLAKKPDLRLEDFANETMFVLPEAETPLSREIVKGYFLSHSIIIRTVEKPTRDSILLEISTGRGFCVFCSQVRYRFDPQIFGFSLGKLIPICAIWKKNNLNPLIPVLMEQTEKFKSPAAVP